MASRWKRVSLVSLALVALFGLAYGLRRAGLEDADKWASILALFVTLISIFVTFFQPREDAASAAAAFNALLALNREEMVSRNERFDQEDIYAGPCLILNRHSGLALDAKADTVTGGHNTLWPAHAAPWQQWRIRRIADDKVEIVSESTGLLLTTMRTGGDWAEVWMGDKRASDLSTSWRLRPTEDRVAFVIENGSSPHALDPGWRMEEHRSGDPHVWSTNWKPWQQWLIVRLPLR